MGSVIDIKTLTLDELAGVVSLYPWFGSARKELCARMAKMGDWGSGQYADAALYIGSRRIVSDLMRSTARKDYSDKDLKEILKAYITEKAPVEEAPREQQGVRVVGGDFFSKAQYESVSRKEDSIFSSFAAKSKSAPEKQEGFLDDVFCTETLAAIYVEQGYYEQAAKIYSRMRLLYPEKSAYFASLIGKLKSDN